MKYWIVQGEKLQNFIQLQFGSNSFLIFQSSKENFQINTSGEPGGKIWKLNRRH